MNRQNFKFSKVWFMTPQVVVDQIHKRKIFLDNFDSVMTDLLVEYLINVVGIPESELEF